MCEISQPRSWQCHDNGIHRIVRQVPISGEGILPPAPRGKKAYSSLLFAEPEAQGESRHSPLDNAAVCPWRHPTAGLPWGETSGRLFLQRPSSMLHESDSLCPRLTFLLPELRTLGEAVRHETGLFRPAIGACEALQHRHHGQNWKFQGQLNFPLGMKGFVADRQEIQDSQTHHQSCAEPGSREKAFLGKGWRNGEARGIQNPKSFAPLFMLKIRRHCGIVTLLEQIVVKVECTLMIPSQRFVLFLDNRARLHPTLEYLDLLLDFSLLLVQVGDSQIVLAELCTELLKLRRLLLGAWLSIRRGNH